MKKRRKNISMVHRFQQGGSMNVEYIRTVAVIGGGIMGEGIAQNFAQAGLSVKLIDQSKDILDGCLKRININLKQFADNGLLQETIPTIESRIGPFLSQNLKIIFFSQNSKGRRARKINRSLIFINSCLIKSIQFFLSYNNLPICIYL